MKNSSAQKPLLIGAVIVLVAAVLYGVMMRTPQAMPAPGDTTPPPVVTPPTSSWLTYQNQGAGFSIQYPKETKLYEKKDAALVASLSYIPVCDPETMIACMVYPKETYPTSNFSAAGVSVNVIKATTEKDCLAVTNANIIETKTVKINGVDFTMVTTGDAGAGHYVNIHVYRTFHAKTCYEITANVASTQFANYEPGSIREFSRDDETALFVILTKIVESFRFNS